MSLLILIVLLSVTITFVCSIIEAVILSVPHSYVAVLKKRSPKIGTKLESQKEHIDHTLSGILTISTISNTLSGAGVATQVHEIYGSEVVAIASGILTLTILIFAEIIPKTLGSTYSKQLAPVSSHVLGVFNFITYPFGLLSSFLAKILGSHSDSPTITREEMIMNAELSASEGVIHAKESKIIKNLLSLDTLQVKDIMTPRSVLLAYQKDTTVKDVCEKVKAIRFSRIPVFNQNIDDVVGMVLRYQVLDAYSKDKESTRLEELMTPIRTIPKTTSVSLALDDFIKHHDHVFIVVDEYGSTVGLVSLEDAVETLLGVEIVDEKDTVADMRQYAIEQWEKRRKVILKN